MQQVANILLIENRHVLMIKKPSRNWYAIPGGKMEFGESIKQGAQREFKEETGLTLQNPKLSSVFTFVMKDTVPEQWMMYTFVASNSIGDLLLHTREGKLEWIPVDNILNCPMAEGDRTIIEHALSDVSDVLTGTFYYTKEFELLDKIVDREKQKR